MLKSLAFSTHSQPTSLTQMIRGPKQSAKSHHPHTHSCNAEMKNTSATKERRQMEEDNAGGKKVHTYMTQTEKL